MTDDRTGNPTSGQARGEFPAVPTYICPRCRQVVAAERPLARGETIDQAAFPEHICPGTREVRWDRRGTR